MNKRPLGAKGKKILMIQLGRGFARNDRNPLLPSSAMR
jgi:hypothetical protein